MRAEPRTASWNSGVQRRRWRMPPGRRRGFTLTEGRACRRAAACRGTTTRADACASCYAGAFTETFGGGRLDCTPGTLKITPAGERHRDRLRTGETPTGCWSRRISEVSAWRPSGPYSPELLEQLAFDERLATAGLAGERHGAPPGDDAAAPLAIEGLMLEMLAGAALSAADPTRASCPLAGRRARPISTIDRRRVGQPGRSWRARWACIRSRWRGRSGGRTGAASATTSGGSGSRKPPRRLADSRRSRWRRSPLAAGFADQSHFSNVFRRDRVLAVRVSRAVAVQRIAGDEVQGIHHAAMASASIS